MSLYSLKRTDLVEHKEFVQHEAQICLAYCSRFFVVVHGAKVFLCTNNVDFHVFVHIAVFGSKLLVSKAVIDVSPDVPCALSSPGFPA